MESRGRPRWWTRYVPFVLVAVLGLVTLGWPFRDVAHPGWDVAAVLGVALSLLSGAVVLRPGFRHRALRLLPPMIFLVAVVCFREADGGSVSAFTAMVGLPVLWLALYGTLRQVWVAVVGVAVVTSAPLVLVGAPDYPPEDWPRALLWTAFAALVGPLTNGVVSSRAASAAKIRALEPADSRLRGLLTAATEHAIVGTDLEGTITVLSPGAEAILGWSEAEVSGKLPFVAVFRVRELGRRGHALGVPPGFEVLVHAARSGVAERQDWTWIARDGEHRTVSLAINGVRDSYGELTGFIGIATDVTVARRTQAALASQQQVQGLLVDHLPNTVVGLVDADLRWVRVAGSWLTERGHDATAFAGGLLGDQLVVQNAAGLRAMVKDAFAASRNGEFETQRGEWFDIAAVPVNGPTGEPLVLLVCRDVTSRHEVDRERTEMIAALTSSEEGFRTAFENAPVGIALTSVDQGPDAAFLRVNKAFAALVGRTPEEVADTPVDALTHPEDVGQRPLFDGGTRQSYRTRYVTTAGRPLWVEVHASLVHDAAGAPSYVIAHVEDVTARRQSERALFDALEQQRAAAEALQEIDRVRVDTMSTISHELRTPLTSVEGYLEILADGGAGPLTTEQDRMVGVVRRNADRLGRLVDDLLELSRLEAMPTGETLVSDEVDVATLAEAVLETVRPLAEGRRQELDLVLDPGAHWVRGDPEQLDRVLMNLVANASKYTLEGGGVTVRVGSAAGVVRIAVEDTGIGIPEEEQKRLFDRFFRSSTAQSRGIEGTGLGLAIVKSILDRHGGTLTLTSAVDVGSTFTVELPAVERPVALDRALAQGQPDPSR